MLVKILRIFRLQADFQWTPSGLSADFSKTLSKLRTGLNLESSFVEPSRETILKIPSRLPAGSMQTPSKLPADSHRTPSGLPANSHWTNTKLPLDSAELPPDYHQTPTALPPDSQQTPNRSQFGELIWRAVLERPFKSPFKELFWKLIVLHGEIRLPTENQLISSQQTQPGFNLVLIWRSYLESSFGELF